ncbi:hypothetical protein M758_UG005700 [Ceratodon purpureus]|nr:hypothetical protein M758_UG005700 [Ceratodon purpureus]
MAMAMSMAMASQAAAMLHQAWPSSAMSPLPCNSLRLASSCTSRCSNWCAVPQVVAGELGRGFEALRAAKSEGAAPASVEGEEEDGPNLPCGTCDSKGWLVCSFCNGQKTNVQVRANKFYRRCPTCRAVGVVICPQCKVFKCVTFPDGVDGY